MQYQSNVFANSQMYPHVPLRRKPFISERREGNVKWTKCFKDYNVTAISISLWHTMSKKGWYVGK